VLRLLLVVLLTPALAAAPPPTKLMYFMPEPELKLAVALRREYYPWPVMRLGIGESGKNWFGHIRFWVAPGAGRAHILRQSRQAALLAFRLFPRLVTLDIDVAAEDDTAIIKAVPWFAATLQRQTVLTTALDLTPQTWFEAQGPVTLRAELHPEGDPVVSLAQALSSEWKKPLPPAPKPASPPR
jgi:hypothetical protein